MSPSLGPIQAH
ncbi:hypothetical protein D043_0024A, partial [Vibrio parahaemolyticus EKP-021]